MSWALWALAKDQKFIPHSPTGPAVLLLPLFLFLSLFLHVQSVERREVEPRPWPPGGVSGVDMADSLESDEDSPWGGRAVARREPLLH